MLMFHNARPGSNKMPYYRREDRVTPQ